MVLKFESDTFVSSKRPQILAAYAAAIGAFTLGNVVAWTSPALAGLKSSERFNAMTETEISWIASLVPLGAVLGGPMGGFAIGRYGRQLSTLLFCFPFAFGWLLIAFAHNVLMMCIGRFITGLCGGAYCLCIPIYLSEIPEESIRGIAGAAFAIFCGLGVLFTYALGAFVSWETLTFVSTCVPLIHLVCIYFAPESPTFLISKGRRRAAGESLRRLRGAAVFDQIAPELALLECSVGRNRRTQVSLKDFFAPGVLKPLIISAVLMFLQQMSGINAVIFYTVDIFRDAGSDINPNLASIIIAVVLLIGMLATTVFIDKAGRKPLLLISDALASVCLFGLGIFFHAKSNNNDVAPENWTWLPLASLLIYAIAFNIGLGPLPWLMMAEILPPHVKGLTSAFVTSFNWMLAFFVTMFFLQISVQMGTATCYFIFCGCSVLGTVFIYFFVPETKGKTLDEIQKGFL